MSYEIVFVEEQKIFISEVEGYDIYKNKASVFSELKDNFPNKRIIAKISNKWFELFWSNVFYKVLKKEYVDETPSKDKITGCPNSIFLKNKKPKKVLSNTPYKIKNNKS